MTLQSMTGFARSEGVSGRYGFVWELRCVNGKGLDMRLRLPAGCEGLEAGVRAIAAKRLARGHLQAGLTLAAADSRLEAVVNREALGAVLALKRELGAAVSDAPLAFDTLLSVRGLIEFREAQEAAGAVERRDGALLAAFASAVEWLVEMRGREGAALGGLLGDQIDRIDALRAGIEADPSRRPAEIAARLAGQIALIFEAVGGLDRDRLHAEAVLLAAKADLREEIDRLAAHIAAARDLLEKGGPVGRKLDFLAQEFNREANTICSKSNAAAVSAAGIELKVVIDQFREQVQNLE